MISRDLIYVFVILLLFATVIVLLYYVYLLSRNFWYDSNEICTVRVCTNENIMTKGLNREIDGVVVSDGDLVCVRKQNLTSQNGLYLVREGVWEPYTLVELRTGYLIRCQDGLINGGRIFYVQRANINNIGGVGGDNVLLFVNLLEPFLPPATMVESISEEEREQILISDNNNVNGVRWVKRSDYLLLNDSYGDVLNEFNVQGNSFMASEYNNKKTPNILIEQLINNVVTSFVYVSNGKIINQHFGQTLNITLNRNRNLINVMIDNSQSKSSFKIRITEMLINDSLKFKKQRQEQQNQ